MSSTLATDSAERLRRDGDAAVISLAHAHSAHVSASLALRHGLRPIQSAIAQAEADRAALESDLSAVLAATARVQSEASEDHAVACAEAAELNTTWERHIDNIHLLRSQLRVLEAALSPP
jgi:hypothetical protein|eukprot:gnl/Ergobibamus_cyprinoides/1497.p1 GENE.gnl/Ergobibamus_cyprinoides/1497~~gnl/Ergobibamus_cyprinoides/1497.p1  ORF type:complete len:129 (+),score=12.49 gnl/Ergobibamus_cyprinoides/1497:28-387(+)